MRALRIALVLALTAGATATLSDQSAFARSAGGNGGGAGAAGGGAAGGGTGAGAGSNPFAVRAFSTLAPRRRVAVPYVNPDFSASCFKQDALYDRYGYEAFKTHGVDCYE